jgi:hypothetical protein
LILPGDSTTAKDAGSGTLYVNLTSESNTASPANANIGIIVGGAAGGAVVFVFALFLLWKVRTMLKRSQVNVEPSPAVLKRPP